MTTEDLDARLRRALAERADGVATAPAPFDEVLRRAVRRHAEQGSAPVSPALTATVSEALEARSGSVTVDPSPFDDVVRRAGGTQGSAAAPTAPAPPPGSPPPSSGGVPRALLVAGAVVVAAALAVTAYALSRDDSAGPAATTSSSSTSTSSSTTSTTSTTTTTTTSTTTTLPPAPPAVDRLTVSMPTVDLVVVDGEANELPFRLRLIDPIRGMVFEDDVPEGMLVAVGSVATGERRFLPPDLAGRALDVPEGVDLSAVEIAFSRGRPDPSTASEIDGDGCVGLETEGIRLCLVPAP